MLWNLLFTPKKHLLIRSGSGRLLTIEEYCVKYILMPKRYIPFVKNEIYHIYNRGVAKQPIFLDKRDYEKFILTLTYYRYNNLPLKQSRFLQLAQKERHVIMAKLNPQNNKIDEV